MFTGIIQAIGSIASLEQRGGDMRLGINAGKLPLADVGLGDSIAVSGVCLTVVGKTATGFQADVSGETLAKTSFKQIKVGSRVNLEKALLPTTHLGGHIVSGHVDGIASVLEKIADGSSFRFKFQAPDELAKYIAEKGSICIDGISLTVNEVDGAVFNVNIVPHTLIETTLGVTEVGSQVNIEVDLLARYMERLMKGEAAAGCAGGVSKELLQNSGFFQS